MCLKNDVATHTQPFPSYCPQETPLAHAKVMHRLSRDPRQFAVHGILRFGANRKCSGPYMLQGLARCNSTLSSLYQDSKASPAMGLLKKYPCA
jgi:hypothetical protein